MQGSPSKLPRSAQEIWGAALGALQLEVSRNNYETWLKNTLGLRLDGTVLTIGVPSSFAAEWLERRLSPIVQKTLRAVYQGDLQVRYVVRQPLADAHVELLAGDASEPSFARRGASRTSPRDFPLLLNPRYTFDTFVVGKSNRFAHAAAMAVAENPGHSYNPLFIHAGVGLGKTHLLHAIGHSLVSQGRECLYVSAEQFTNDFVNALRENRSEDFRNKYRTTDVLLIDDIQFIAGKEQSKESFFHTFNDLHSANKQIVITSDSRPKSIPLVEERLISRFEGGLIADIAAPELETRLAILQSKAAAAGLRLGADVASFIARKVLRNVRELEGVLNRLLAMAKLTNHPIDMALAHRALTEIPSSPRRQHNFSSEAILSAVTSFYGLSLSLLTGKSRKKDVAKARQVAAYLLREETPRSLAEVGSLIGERGHTTALRAHDKIASELNIDVALQNDLAEIRARLDGDSVSAAS